MRQVAGDEVSQLAFDVCTEEEAKTLESREESEAKVRKAADDDVRLSPARVCGQREALQHREPACARARPPRVGQGMIRVKAHGDDPCLAPPPQPAHCPLRNQ